MTIAEIRDIQTPDLVKKVSELKQELFALIEKNPTIQLLHL